MVLRNYNFCFSRLLEQKHSRENVSKGLERNMEVKDGAS